MPERGFRKIGGVVYVSRTPICRCQFLYLYFRWFVLDPDPAGDITSSVPVIVLHNKFLCRALQGYLDFGALTHRQAPA